MSDDEADGLYGLPLAEFVPARGELAKRLRADGRREDAAAVAKLRKPSVAAWAANQVLRSQRADARELLAAGDALTEADSATLREAITRHREVLGRLLAAANGLLDENGRGLSATTLERVQQTLNAASLDPELREEAEGARLTKEHTYSGLGLRAASKGTTPEPEQAEEPPPPSPKKNPAAAIRRAAAEKRLEKAKAAVRAAEARLDRAREREADARAELDAL